MTLGTIEWAQKNVNIATGCPHDCRYCYAREMAVRHHRCIKEDWPKIKINQAAVDKVYRRNRKFNWENGREDYRPSVMFPSAHDIVPGILSESLCVLRKLLEAGNEVLVVSKPHLVCIEEICNEFRDYKDRLKFRFTIGSTDDATLRFWDRGAPNFIERHACLIYAHQLGYSTSASCEPYLSDPLEVYEKLKEYITDTFWVGPLNKFKRRVDLRGVTTRETKLFVAPLLASITPTGILEIYEKMRMFKNVRFKDSFREILEAEK